MAVTFFSLKVTLNFELMKGKFVTNNVPYSLRSGNDLLNPNTKNTKVGIETTPFIGPKLWQLLPFEIKTASSLLAVFENRRNHGKGGGGECNCRLRHIFIQNPVFYFEHVNSTF